MLSDNLIKYSIGSSTLSHNLLMLLYFSFSISFLSLCFILFVWGVVFVVLFFSVVVYFVLFCFGCFQVYYSSAMSSMLLISVSALFFCFKCYIFFITGSFIWTFYISSIFLLSITRFFSIPWTYGWYLWFFLKFLSGAITGLTSFVLFPSSILIYVACFPKCENCFSCIFLFSSYLR